MGLSPPFHEPAIQHERSGPRRVLTQALDPEPQLGGAPALQPSSLVEEEVFLQPSTALQSQATDSDSDAGATAETDIIPEEVFLQASAATTESDSDDSAAEADAAATADDTAEADAVEDAAGVDSELLKALKAAVRLCPTYLYDLCFWRVHSVAVCTETWSVQGLSDHVAVLREVGVESLSDIRYLDEVRRSTARSPTALSCL